MKYILTIFALITFTSHSQKISKKQLLSEVDVEKKKFIDNKKFDCEHSVLYNAILSVGSELNDEIKKESEKRGFIDFYREREYSKHTFSVEIISDEKPFDLRFQIESYSRNLDFVKGGYSDWRKNNTNSSYITNFKIKVYEKVFGTQKILSDELLKKIESFNTSQKKDKNKIIEGIDY